MRMTVSIDDELLERARKLTSLRDAAVILHEGLRALIARESARRLAALGGSEPHARAPRRRRGRA
jgi:hypothetical protein